LERSSRCSARSTSTRPARWRWCSQDHPRPA
jgi:hypothetical protein